MAKRFVQMDGVLVARWIIRAAAATAEATRSFHAFAAFEASLARSPNNACARRARMANNGMSAQTAVTQVYLPGCWVQTEGKYPVSRRVASACQEFWPHSAQTRARHLKNARRSIHHRAYIKYVRTSRGLGTKAPVNVQIARKKCRRAFVCLREICPLVRAEKTSEDFLGARAGVIFIQARRAFYIKSTPPPQRNLGL